MVEHSRRESNDLREYFDNHQTLNINEAEEEETPTTHHLVSRPLIKRRFNKKFINKGKIVYKNRKKSPLVNYKQMPTILYNDQ